MDVVVRGRQIEVPEKFREHVSVRLQRLEKHGFALTRVDVEITQERNPRLADHAIRVELTCHSRGPVVRAEYAAADKFVAFDCAADRLDERLRRNAERRRARERAGGRVGVPERIEEAVTVPVSAEAPEVTAPDEAGRGEPDLDVILAAGPLIVREKTHPTVAMTVEQALEAMELVGHDFYLFLDASNGKPSVVYRRRGYDYGLIRLEVDAAEAAS